MRALIIILVLWAAGCGGEDTDPCGDVFRITRNNCINAGGENSACIGIANQAVRQCRDAEPLAKATPCTRCFGTCTTSMMCMMGCHCFKDPGEHWGECGRIR